MILDFGNLLHWAIVFLVIALVSALFGFTNVSGTAMEGAKMLCGVAFLIAVVAFVFSLPHLLK